MLQVGTQQFKASSKIGPNSATRLVNNIPLEWPTDSHPEVFNQTLLLRMKLVDLGNQNILATNEYWQSNPAQKRQAYTDLGQLREHERRVRVNVQVLEQSVGDDRLEFKLRLSNDNANAVALFIRLQLHWPSNLSRNSSSRNASNGANETGDHGEVDLRILPVWWSTNYLSLVPNEQVDVEAWCSTHDVLHAPNLQRGEETIRNRGDIHMDGKMSALEIHLDGWNVLQETVSMTSVPMSTTSFVSKIQVQ